MDFFSTEDWAPEHLAAARLLGRLIEHGFAPSSPDLPPEWQPIYDAVYPWRDSSREHRKEIFGFAIEKNPFAYEIRMAVLNSLPEIDDRLAQNRVLYRTSDALNLPPHIDWCVDQLFARPSLNVIVGDPGAKKTYLALDLAMCVALGKPWLGRSTTPSPLVIPNEAEGRGGIRIEPIDSSTILHEDSPLISNEEDDNFEPFPNPFVLPNNPFTKQNESTQGIQPENQSTPAPTTGSPVLFIDEETGLNHFWNRVNAVAKAHRANHTTPFSFVSLGGYDLNSKDDARALLHRALGEDARLIIFDSLTTLLRGAGDNNFAVVQPVLFALRCLAEKAQAAVVVIHHTNKLGDFRGTNAISAAADLMLQVRSAPADSLIEFHTAKARFVAPLPFCARADFSPAPDGSPRFLLSQTDAKPSDEKPSSPSQTNPDVPAAQSHSTALSILNYLSTVPSATRSQIAFHLNSVSPTTVRTALHKLKTAGLIRRSNQGGKGKKGFYALRKD